jgi:NAD(P)-dependent dehydrogenase (short-subunit alcohol dehydrogenase family)
MKSVVITGASRGIGLALTTEFLLHQYRVAALCRDPDSAEHLQTLARDHQDRLLLERADVTDGESLLSAAESIGRRFTGGVDILVNNAGMMLSRETPDPVEFDLNELRSVLEVNTIGPLRVTQAILPLLRHRREDSDLRLVVNITSIMGSLHHLYGQLDGRRNYSYSVSKAALNMLSMLLHRDLVEESIGVFAAHPGWVQTGMGGDRAPVTPVESAAGLFAQIIAWRPGDPEVIDFRGRDLLRPEV